MVVSECGGGRSKRDAAQRGGEMHLAIQNSFPNLSISAEREFISRVHIAGAALGWEVSDAVTSDDILACKPDMVLVTHEFSPKLTSIPTIGVIWSPTSYFEDDPVRLRNILSYDGCLVATPELRSWATDFFARHRKIAPISHFNFLPTAINQGVPAQITDPVLFYAGVHWDRKRHGSLFSHLDGQCPLRIFGKPEQWKGKTQNYVGTLPFDGTGVVTAIANCGITLALHTEAHRKANVPSMRLFEGAAAGAVVIADRMPFSEAHFGDTVLWVNVEKPAKDVAQQIIDHVDWVRNNPTEAKDLAMRANSVFVDDFDLKDQLRFLPKFLEEVVQSMVDPLTKVFLPEQVATSERPSVEVIMLIESRPASMIDRALYSLAAQSYPNLSLILIKFRDVDGLDVLVAKYQPQFTSIRIVEVDDDGIRSSALWAGLNAVSGKYLANLDVDDTIHPGHFAGLVAALESAPENVPLAYTGTIEVQDKDGLWFDQPNFHGDLTETIKERRRLRFLDPFSAERMKSLDSFISSNAWMVRRSALTPDVLQNPAVEVREDMYLYLMLMRQGPLEFVPVATADSHSRTMSQDKGVFAAAKFVSNVNAMERLLYKYGALEKAPRSLRPAQDPLPTIRTILRKPSLLLGSYAPRWRRFRQAVRNRLAAKR